MLNYKLYDIIDLVVLVMYMKKDKKSIDEYIKIAKGDVDIHLFVAIILFLILIYVSYKCDCYYFLFIELFQLIRLISRVDGYFNIKKIKEYLIENNLIDKIGDIDFWNEKDYILSDKYMIIKRYKKVYAFKYSDIEKIYKKTCFTSGRYSQYEEYLTIVTNDNEFEILIYTSVLVEEEYKDISEYLLKKNPNIIVGETIKK